jgi:hypothetical protein
MTTNGGGHTLKFFGGLVGFKMNFAQPFLFMFDVSFYGSFSFVNSTFWIM